MDEIASCLRFEVLTALKMSIVVFSVVTPYDLVDSRPEDGGDTILRNVGDRLQDHMAPQPSRPR
jgi:hypothetical protein